MSHNRIKQALAVASLVAAATAVRAAPVEHDGRFYEVVISDGIPWEQARDAANAMTLDGIQGHLATINSPEEDEFVYGLTVGIGELWIGGNQIACTPTPSPGCGWAWRNVSGQDVGEPISATNNTSPPFSIDDPYTNWQPTEPNDHLGVDEVGLGIGLGGNRGWNDEGFLSNIRGYVVEYGDRLVQLDANDCKPGPCNLTGGGVNGTLYSLPASAVIPSANNLITVRTWLINDPASRCVASPGHAPQPLPLDLLEADGSPGQDGDPDVVIPSYLCTHPENPQFVVIKTSSAVQIPSGVVAITNDTSKLLNPSYICQAPIQNGNPLAQDVVVFQYDNKSDMLETGFTSLVDGEFDGTVIESTNGCINPSRGSGGKGSFIFVGLSIQQGTASSVQARLVNLLRHKLDLLGLAVNTAKSAGALKNGDYNKLISEVNACRGDLTNGNFKEAFKHVQNFQKFLNAAVITPATGTARNHDGEMRMRIDNIGFTLKVKVMLQSP
jgi:hypothetical protein